MRWFAEIGAALAMVAGLGSAAQAQEAKPVEVMVLGTWHFANPGLDLHNVISDDVTKPGRQAELKALAAALAEFRPTKIMVERIAKTADMEDPNYAAFTTDQLGTNPDERVQIGYRIAHQLGHKRVYAIDVQGEFPYGKVVEFAKANGREARLSALSGEVGTAVRAFNEMQARHSLATLLIGYNDPRGFQSGIDGYYELLKFGDGANQPGAELNAMWYMRNARSWTKLTSLTEPGDRVLVIFGGGHNYWLRHFASESRGFRAIDPRPYLEKAAAARVR
jgi:hypothetical protein